MELKSRVDRHFLPYVVKPARYLGNEYHAANRRDAETHLAVAVCYADLYDRGIANPDFDYLYHWLNSRPGVAAERVYAPAADAERLLREKEIPLFSLEDRREVSGFALLLFYVEDPLSFINVITMLDLSRLAVESQNRDGAQPLIAACGPAMDNPEPLAPFVDAVIIGRGEAALTEMTRRLPDAGSPAGKEELLRRLRGQPGVYLPADYQPRYSEYGEFLGLRPAREQVPARVSLPAAPVAGEELLGFHPLVPVGDVGRSFAMDSSFWGMRQSAGGGAARCFPPVTSTLSNRLFHSLRQLHRQTYGDDGFALTADHGRLRATAWMAVKEQFLVHGKQLRISPSAVHLGNEGLDAPEIFAQLHQELFWIFPMSGSRRLRHLANINLEDDQITRTAEAALRQGWSGIGLYFQIGLPSEKRAEAMSLTKLLSQVKAAAESFPERRLSVFLDVFVPRPHSALQWEKAPAPAVAGEMLEALAAAVRQLEIDVQTVDPLRSALRTVLSRGDRRTAEGLRQAWEQGGRIEEGQDQLDAAPWKPLMEAEAAAGGDRLQPLSITVALPWDHIDLCVSRGELREEKLNAQQGRLRDGAQETVAPGDWLPHSRWQACLLQAGGGAPTSLSGPPAGTAAPSSGSTEGADGGVRYGRREKRRPAAAAPVIKRRVRVRYSKIGAARFYSNADIGRIFGHSARRAGIPLVFSRSDRPSPKISYGPPLPPGIASTAEYLDMELLVGQEADLQHRFNHVLPEGIQILQYQELLNKVPALSSVINRATYELYLSDSAVPPQWLDHWLELPEVWVERTVKDGVRKFDIRPHVSKMACANDILTLAVDVIDGRNVRVTEVLETLLAPHGVDYRQYPIQRTGQFIVGADSIATPGDLG